MLPFIVDIGLALLLKFDCVVLDGVSKWNETKIDSTAHIKHIPEAMVVLNGIQLGKVVHCPFALQITFRLLSVFV